MEGAFWLPNPCTGAALSLQFSSPSTYRLFNVLLRILIYFVVFHLRACLVVAHYSWAGRQCKARDCLGQLRTRSSLLLVYRFTTDRMEVAHTRAASEPILLATTCHNMDLFAIVTRSIVTVYRSTTLTVVTTLPLSMESHEKTVSACWSPSGRLLAIGLQRGEVFLLDVESGDLVRHFAPHEDAAYRHGANEECDTKKTLPERKLDFAAVDKEEEAAEDNVDPLRRPPKLPISVAGAIVACTWPSVATRMTMAIDHKERCLPLRSTVSSSILDELEREDETSVLLLLDERGGLSCLTGGIQEVAFVHLNLPISLALDTVHVESFFVSTLLPQHSSPTDQRSACSAWTSTHLDRASASASDDNEICGRAGSSAHIVYITVRGMALDCPSEVMRVDVSGVIAGVTVREVVAVCSIAEYCRMGNECFAQSLKRWTGLVHVVHKDLLLPGSALLLRDALIEEVACPSHRELLDYFAMLDLTALVKDAEELSKQFVQLVLQISNVVYRCFDIALHVSQTQCSDRRRQCLLLDVISRLRQRCSNFMRQMRLEVDREKELLQWVTQRASLLTGTALPMTEVFALNEPLRATWHPLLLRTLHRIGRGESATLSLMDFGDAQMDGELAQIVRKCLLGRCEATGCRVRLQIEDILPLELQQCEMLLASPPLAAEGEGRIVIDAAQLRVVAAIEGQSFMTHYAIECREDEGYVFVQQREWAALDMTPIQISESNATLLWSTVADDEGRCVLLFERKDQCTPSQTLPSQDGLYGGGTDTTLVVVLVNESGDIEQQAYGEATEQKYATLEIKGISSAHLRASVSRARSFGVLYALERFIVFNFYGV
uniref:Anaphase-promoting complex subunit 4-like WD40 domain-containing protein n=1 Tax=Trypanosoma vivax (strain Y486) TaxID=1055687 RepID=G0UBA7_TRYVY|nr:conserved hypothetical protein [Trypanosoma vivax Y486]